MGKIARNTKLVAVFVFIVALAGCAAKPVAPPTQTGINNRTATIEMSKLAQAAGFTDNPKPVRGCAMPNDCSATQEFSVVFEEPNTSLTERKACEMFTKFARSLDMSQIEVTVTEPRLKGDLSDFEDGQVIQACIGALKSGLDGNDFSILSRYSSLPVHMTGSFEISDGKMIRYLSQFNSYLDKDGSRGLYLYISAQGPG
jgi:hypothetical protein